MGVFGNEIRYRTFREQWEKKRSENSVPSIEECFSDLVRGAAGDNLISQVEVKWLLAEAQSMGLSYTAAQSLIEKTAFDTGATVAPMIQTKKPTSKERSLDMTKQERAEMYRSYLAGEGYSPEIDDDGDILFKYEGHSFFIEVAEKDEEYFRVVFPNFWSIESEAERQKVSQASLHATHVTKVAKVFPVQDNTWAAIEMFCSPPEVFKASFRRCLIALQVSTKNFKEKMLE